MYGWSPLLCLVVCLVGFSNAEEISVSFDEGIDLILHEDFTWEPGENVDWVPPGVFEVTLEDGRNLILHNDFTWSCVSSVDGEEMPLQTAYSVGKARREHWDAAREDAEREAVRRLAIQLNSLKPGADLLTLAECIALQEKSVDVSERSQSGWEISVRIEVGPDAIRTILDCAQTTTPRKGTISAVEPQ